MSRRDRFLSNTMGVGRPRRRFTRKSLAGTEPIPRFQEGDVAGRFTVLHYRGWSRVNPDNRNLLHADHHWYLCQCDCGNKENHTQQQLIDTRRKRQCAECTSKERKNDGEDTSDPYQEWCV